jgi:hypothetical protein
MLEVHCSNGDWAEPADDTPECAVATGLQLLEDAWRAMPVQGKGEELTASFYCDGALVATANRKALLAVLPTAAAA